MRRRTARLLRRLCLLYPCAVISGRGRADVAARLAGAPVKYVVGNHGLEEGRAPRELAAEIATVRVRLTTALAGTPGVDLEDKRYSLSLHYRRARNKRRARTAIHDVLAALPQSMRVVPGKQVFNVVPGRGANKGKAMLTLLSREKAIRALYVGDDVTDEDVFALLPRRGVLGVRVGRARRSAAVYFVHDQRAVDRLLETLIVLRSVSPELSTPAAGSGLDAAGRGAGLRRRGGPGSSRGGS